jgi:tRNA-2-methylthio-N6-dimethylallyladenosine synthase
MTDLPKTYRVKSFGCQMNVYDGERMAELLGAQGMVAVADGEDADLVVLNTCHIREKAAEKAYSDVGRLRREDGSKPMVALAGCVAQAEGAEAKTRSSMIDLVVGPQAYHRLPEMVAEAANGHRPVDTDMPAISKFGALPVRRKVGPSAFLTVQEGCDKFCTYCVVPYTRGAESAARGRTSLPKRFPSSMAALAKSPCSGRTSTPGQARMTRDASADSIR